jgi:hypothetical protein
VLPKISDQEAASLVMELFPVQQYPLRRPVKMQYIILNTSQHGNQAMPVHYYRIPIMEYSTWNHSELCALSHV